jgi:hypothetical protein
MDLLLPEPSTYSEIKRSAQSCAIMKVAKNIVKRESKNFFIGILIWITELTKIIFLSILTENIFSREKHNNYLNLI